mgnify:FL=1
MNYTPGPWIVDGNDICAESGELLATAYVMADGSSNGANARLIAALPELLKCVMEINSNWSDDFVGPDDNRAIGIFTDRTIDIWRSIRVAIAKAGEHA